MRKGKEDNKPNKGNVQYVTGDKCCGENNQEMVERMFGARVNI